MQLPQRLSYTVAAVANDSWVQQIKDSYVPLKIDEGLYIVPEWSEAPDPLATNIILQPGVAFGTGGCGTWNAGLVLVLKAEVC